MINENSQILTANKDGIENIDKKTFEMELSL